MSIKPKALKERKKFTCPMCSELFVKAKIGQRVCGGLCALKFSREEAARRKDKEQRAKLKMRKLDLKPRSYWVKQAQTAFNKFIRARDIERPCISCGILNPPDLHGGQWDCGHFLSVGSHPELRFEEKNAYKQCKSCNGGAGQYTKKNYTVGRQYEENLVETFGQELVDWLNGPHEAKHYSIDDLKDIRDRYRKKLKQLQTGEGAA